MTLVVFDTAFREFQGNRIFDPEVAASFPGAFPMIAVHRCAARHGFEMITSDVYLAARRGERGLLYSDMDSATAGRLVRAGLMPAVSVCAESPLVAYEFYHDLDRHSRRYPHVFYFRGMRPRVTSPGTEFHVMYFPQSRRDMSSGLVPWGSRRHLAMVAAAKSAFPRRKIHNLKDLRREWIRRKDPWMRSDLYRERLRAIEGFSRFDDFHLYGHGWKEYVERGEGDAVGAVARAWRGAVADKIGTLSGYRFCLCFENTRFPGYVTEKIFDAFFAGSIPVYFGAPDIADFVPEGTYIDFSRFRSHAELDARLRAMTEGDAMRILDRIRAFLASEAFEKYRDERFAGELVGVFRAVAARGGLS